MKTILDIELSEEEEEDDDYNPEKEKEVGLSSLSASMTRGRSVPLFIFTCDLCMSTSRVICNVQHKLNSMLTSLSRMLK